MWVIKNDYHRGAYPSKLSLTFKLDWNLPVIGVYEIVTKNLKLGTQTKGIGNQKKNH